MAARRPAVLAGTVAGVVKAALVEVLAAAIGTRVNVSNRNTSSIGGAVITVVMGMVLVVL